MNYSAKLIILEKENKRDAKISATILSEERKTDFQNILSYPLDFNIRLAFRQYDWVIALTKSEEVRLGVASQHVIRLAPFAQVCVKRLKALFW
jgi:hypothetical protein